MAKIAIIEDNRPLVRSLKDQLNGLADQIVSFPNLYRSYSFFEKNTVELVLVDRQLEDGDGLEFVEYLHETHFYTRVLVLSQLGSVPDKIKGLNLGADDYLAKPFHPVELKLRVKKLLNKEKQQPQELLYGGSLTLNPATGQLDLLGKKVKLRKKEAQILAMLMRYQNQVVTHAQIAQKIWPGEKFYPARTTINVYMRRLRIKLGERKNLIETIRKFGYRLQTFESVA